LGQDLLDELAASRMDDEAAKLVQRWQTAKQEHMARHTNRCRSQTLSDQERLPAVATLESRIAALPGAGGYLCPLYQRDEETERVSA